MKPILSFILITGLFFLSCTLINRKQVQNTEIKPIVLIFDSIKSNYDTLFFDREGEAQTPTPVLSVKLSSSHFIIPEVKDTITIIPELDYVIVTHKYLPYSSAEFILKAGDTAHIGYINGVAYVDIPNRETKTFDVNYEYFKRLRFPLVENMSTLNIMEYPDLFYFKKWNKGDRSSSILKVLDEFTPKFLNELEDEKSWLDSIYQVKQITDQEYHFYKERNKYTSLREELKTKTAENLVNKMKGYNDSLYINDVAGYYKNYFYKTGINYMNKIFFTFKENQYTGAYDFLENCKDITGKLAQDLRQTALISILQKYPLDIRKEYFNKFASSVSDTTLIRNIEKAYENLLNPEIAASEDLVLLSADGRKTNLTEILKQCKGKTVYVDFWASWCAPCLREMPFSKKLREDAAYKDIVFIYLSIYDEKEPWKAAWGKAELENQLHNYLILNSKDTPFVKKYKINSIPRYMIFDKDGQLLNDNAPVPSDKKLDLLTL